MKTTLKLGLVALIAMLASGGCDRREPAEPAAAPAGDTAEQTTQGQTAPDFTLTDHTGATHTLSDLRGKTVVLEWFNIECPFVVRHHETKTTMTDLAGAYADNDVVWLAINSTSHFTPEMNKTTAERLDLPYPLLNDQDGTVGRAYGATRTPEMVIIDTNGRIVYHGAIDNDPRGNTPDDQIVNYVALALDELLAGQPVSTSETAPYGCTIKWAQ